MELEQVLNLMALGTISTAQESPRQLYVTRSQKNGSTES